MKFTIKHITSDLVLFECEAERLALAVESAVESGANLYGANLRCADLYGADLGGAYLSDADLRGADLYDADLRGAYLRGADLRCADLGGANLRGANLRGANLGGANLRGANLRGANLSDAIIKDNIIIQKTPLQIYGAHWDITIWDNHMIIGCEFHLLSDWFEFEDREINRMDPHALKFWRQWKGPLIGICVAEKRYQFKAES